MSLHTYEPVAQLKCSVQVPETNSISNQLVLTFVDCCAAGPRILSSILRNGSAKHQKIDIKGIEEAQAVIDQGLETVPYTLATASQPAVTHICINSHIAGRNVAHAAAGLVSWLQDQFDCNSSMQPVVVAAAAVMQGVKSKGLHTMTVNGASVPQSLASCPAVPGNMKVQDAFLASLLQALLASGLPTVCLLAQGFKPSISSDLSDSVDEVMCLAQGLATAGLLGNASAGVTKESVAGVKLLNRWWLEGNTAGGEVMYV